MRKCLVWRRMSLSWCKLFYCCVTDEHKLSPLKQYTLAHCFCGSGAQAQRNCIQCSGLHKDVIKDSVDCAAWSQEPGALSRAHVLVDRIWFLAVLGLRFQLSNCLSAPGVCPQSRPMWSSHKTVVYFFKGYRRSCLQSASMEPHMA